MKKALREALADKILREAPARPPRVLRPHGWDRKAIAALGIAAEAKRERVWRAKRAALLAAQLEAAWKKRVAS